MKKYNIITYGCQMNEHDSENIAGMLDSMNYIYTDNPLEADIVVMNTCSIREHADKRFFGMLGQFKNIKKNNRDFILCICGCMPQQDRIVEEIKNSFSWVDIIFGTHTIGEFPNLLKKRLETGKKQISIVGDSSKICTFENTRRLFKHKALVNITYGCNNFCTYCIVPYTRGREKSRSLDDVVREIKSLSEDGVIEVTLLGQNVNSFKDINGNDFSGLIREVNKIDRIKRIRFMTSHPKDISDSLIECYRDCEKLCKHIHLPVQSGNNEILRRMNRHYDVDRYKEIILKLRKVCPDIAISTDIIVGFPGESDDEFKDTLDLIKEVQFDSAFTFIYSPRPGTPAADFDNQIPDKIKHERFDRLTEIVNESSLRKNKMLENKIVPVLVDGKSKRNNKMWTGRSEDFKLINFFSKRENLTGEIVPVLIDEAKTFSLDGREDIS